MKSKKIVFIILISLMIGNVLYLSNSNAHSQYNQKQQAIKKGLKLFKAEELDASAEVFENILSHDKNTLIAKEMLAVISYRKGDYKEAETLARLSLQQNRRSAKAHLVLSGVYQKNGNILAARDHFRKAKKYANPREKEFVTEYLKTDSKTDLERLEKISLNRGKLQTKIPAAGAAPYIAIFSFEDFNQEEEGGDLGKTFAEMLTTALITTNRYQVLERSQLDKILEEQALGLTGTIDEETAVDVGELLGIDAVVVGSGKYLDDQIEIDARIVDAQTGKAHVAASVSAEDESDLREASKELAKKLAAGADNISVKRDKEKTDH